MTDQAVSVIHLITDLDVGGAEIALLRLVSTASLASIRHHVVSLKSNGRLESEIRSLGIPVTVLDLNDTRSFGHAFVRLARLLRAERPDVVITWLYHADLLDTLTNLLTIRTRLIWNIRCADMDLSRYSAMTRALPRILAWLSRRPDVIIANSNAGRIAHEAYGYRTTAWKVIPNGFDTSRFHPDTQARQRTRADLGVEITTPLVGLIARFDPMKDHETFFFAAAKVIEAVPSVRFLLVGRGTEGAEIRQLIAASGAPSNRFILLGERLDIPDILAALDLGVSSSRTEGFSNTIGESMASGVPCVVTDVGDSAIIVGDTGRVVPKASPQQLAQAMIEVLTLPVDQRAALGAAARERITRYYAIGGTSQRYAETILNVVNSGL